MAKKLTATFMRKHLTEINKQLRKQTIKDIWKSNKAKITELFNKHLDKNSDGYRPKKDLDKFLEGKKWDFDKFKKLSKPKEEKKPPKPKPTKPKPKPKKNLVLSDSTKSIIDKVLGSKKEIDNLEGFIKLMISNTEPEEPVLFVNWGVMEIVLIYSLMEEAKNDCGYYVNDNDYGRYGQYDVKKIKNVDEEEIKKLMNQIIKCKAQKKIVVVPLHLPGHANMLIFNYHRNEIERFEPWGNKTPYQSTDKNVRKFVKKFNKVLKNNKSYSDKLGSSWKYVDLFQSCPVPPKGEFGDRFRGLQSYFSLKKGSKSKTSNKITLIKKDPGGWCVAYSALYAYLRMKFPKPPANEIQKKIKDVVSGKFDNKSEAFLNFLRRFVKVQEKQLKKLINETIPGGSKVIKTIQALFIKKKFQNKAKKFNWSEKLISLIGDKAFDALPNKYKSFFYIDKEFLNNMNTLLKKIIQEN